MRWWLPALCGAGIALWVDALLGGVLAGNAMCLAMVVGLAVLAGWHSRLPELLLTGLVVAGLLTVANQVASPGEFSFANDGVFYAVVVLGPSLAGWLLGTRSRQLTELRVRTAELEQRRADSVVAARALEAERVERQVDLALSVRLGEILEGVHAADRIASADPGAVPARLAEVEATAREALTELRQVLGVLQPEPPRMPAEPALPPRDSIRAMNRPLDRLDLLLMLAVVPLAVETARVDQGGPIWLNVACCFGYALLLPVVRRRPLVGATALFALATAQTAWLTPLPPTVGWMLPALLVCFLLSITLPRRTAPLGLGLCVLGLGAVTLATPEAQRALDGAIPSLVMIGLVWAAGRSVAVREARAAELRLVVAELARTRDEQVRLAAAEQRAEMARDLHDVGAHALTVVCLQTAAARKLWERDPAQARTALTAVHDLADDSLSHLGDSFGGLAAAESEYPLDPAALDVLTGFGKVLGLDVAIAVRGDPRKLDRAVARTAFRVVQESLTNAARHAAHSRVRIGLDYVVDALEVRVSDSGPGPVPLASAVAVNGSGLGLRGMRERVEACSGELTFGPSGTGFAVCARLPLAVGS